jgi:hypothetical protein
MNAWFIRDRPESRDGVGIGKGSMSKKSTAIKHLRPLARNRWKFGHTVAFLIDSQAKIP